MTGARIMRLKRGSVLDLDARPATIFQSRAWLESLVECGADKSDLQRFDVGPPGACAALLGAPPSKSPIAPRQLWFNESGDAALDRVYPEYNDFLGVAETDDRIAALVAMFDSFPQTEEFYFRNSTPELAHAVRAAAMRCGFEVEQFQIQSTWRIDLAALRAEKQSATDAMTGSTRRRLRQATSFFERRGPLSIRFATAESRASVWRVLSDLHQQSWAARGQEGVFSNPAFTGFHDALWRKAPECAHLLTLVCDGAPIGVLYNLAFGKTVCNYQSGFVRETDNKARPGIVSHILAADYYAEQGYDTYDLLGGGDHYKSTLAQEGDTLASLCVTRPTLKTRGRTALKALVSGLRRAEGKRQT